MVKSTTDVLIIGGGPAGIISAVSTRNTYPDKKIMLVRRDPKVAVPCGIPYMFGTLASPEDNLMGDAPLKAKNVEIKIGLVTEVDPQQKIARLESGEEVVFEKLVLATGSKPIIPKPFRVEKKGIFAVHKDFDYLVEMKRQIASAHNVVIIGGGFIGVELADEINKMGGKVVTLTEMTDHILQQSFDIEFCQKAEEVLQADGVQLRTGVKVMNLGGGDAVEYVELADGEKIPADAVVLAIGSRPIMDLAEKMGLQIAEFGGIKVDEFMRTSHTDIFAVGDCAEKRCFFSRKHSPVMLASTATAEARSAGSNIYSIKSLEMNKGTIGVYSTRVNGLSLGTAGMTESRALAEGFDIVIGISDGIDRHPGTLPGKNKLYVKLLFSRFSGTLLGGQAYGGDSVGELINTIALAVQNKMSMVDLDTIQFGTHPLLTAAPTTYPLIVCASDALKKVYVPA
ncbi:MAG TPA: FAD-dependent oxidoreductase [bacterium]|nr:FAD-dependent oxidoreductase [bacterium]